MAVVPRCDVRRALGTGGASDGSSTSDVATGVVADLAARFAAGELFFAAGAGGCVGDVANFARSLLGAMLSVYGNVHINERLYEQA